VTEQREILFNNTHVDIEQYWAETDALRKTSKSGANVG
jgi:hypothetical protein